MHITKVFFAALALPYAASVKVQYKAVLDATAPEDSGCYSGPYYDKNGDTMLGTFTECITNEPNLDERGKKKYKVDVITTFTPDDTTEEIFVIGCRIKLNRNQNSDSDEYKDKCRKGSIISPEDLEKDQVSMTGSSDIEDFPQLTYTRDWTIEFKKPKGCTKDLKTCCDGTTVPRDPFNDCEFEECPEVVCTADEKDCGPGGFVPRDPELCCEFPECDCPEDLLTCRDGTVLQRDPDNQCGFPDCPGEVVCTDDAKECCYGSWVSRDPNNNCEFEECPLLMCTPDENDCGPGGFVVRDPDLCCDFPECNCPEDLWTCSDGTVLQRDPDNRCEFPDCPTGEPNDVD